MLVYGDHHETAEPKQRAREINRAIDVVERSPAGFERHARLVSVLIDTGQLLQGVADALFAHEQRDRRSDAVDSLNGALLQLGQAVCRSFDSDFGEIPPLPRLEMPGAPPEQVRLKVPEGFAFYALYPEAYIAAARRLRLSAPARVVGVRSIGTSLGAVVAAALGASAAVTLRPFGNPSAREIAVDPALERSLLEGEAHYVIVDEGPGQSGSSFGAVADWLRQRGIADERIALLPSHPAPPGAAASEDRRRWWHGVQREVGDWSDEWPTLIGRWCEPLLGPLDGRPEEISGGGWRPLHYAREQEWPAVVPAWERRKFALSARGERFLVKFAGLGAIGQEKLRIARALHAEGFSPEPIALVHGFIVERWCDALPLAMHERPLREIARYIGTRARLLPAASGSGAGVAELLAMVRRNVAVEFGGGSADLLQAWGNRTAALDRAIVRARTDNKLDPHEWLRTGSGALIKTDALDHHQAHDLIGCQDVAWDCAGATVEFNLDQDQGERLVASVEHWADRDVDRDLLAFYRIAYLAFRVGQARLGETMIGDNSEKRRLNFRAGRYATELQHLLESTPTRLGPDPWSVEHRNEPLREQTSAAIG